MKKKIVMMLLIGVLLLTAGCDGDTKQTDKAGRDTTKVVLTTGFSENEVFRIGKSSCTLPEMKVYLTNTQNQYEAIYGAQIWNTKLEGTTLQDKVKDTVIARVAQIKTMNLLAEDYEVTLSETEQQLAEQAAKDYYDSLTQEEIAYLGVDMECVTRLYGEYALAHKIYFSIIQDVNPEISDDEARTITVKLIFLKKYATDSQGNKVFYADETMAETLQKAKEIQALAAGGEDFDTLISKYSEDENSTYSFGKGEMEQTFEEAAFNLSTDAVSDVVETEYGYYIIKCVSTFDRKETDANKVKIVEQRKKEAFNQVYDDFVKSQLRNLNKELWSTVTLAKESTVDTVEFFQIYEQYFQGIFDEEEVN